ncbi:MAG: hypothetical protein HY644_14000 [Acidobacteria bacterium]|nr:hypothetical protein [Acidobacteriota bacterium]
MTDPTRQEDKNEVQLMTPQGALVAAEIYEDLLNRYERILVFAGQLQEKNRQHLLLQEKNDDLERRVENLKKQVAVEESYVRLLENALKTLGILRE